MYVATIFVPTKMILVAAPANDDRGGYSQTTGSMGTHSVSHRKGLPRSCVNPSFQRQSPGGGSGGGGGGGSESVMRSRYLWIVCLVYHPGFD